MPSPHEWLKSIGATESLREIAARAGVSHATLSRQLTNGRFLIDTSIDLARAYGASPVAALVANGHLTDAEANLPELEVALGAATDEQLVVEIGRRLGVSGSALFDSPLSAAVATANNVVHGRFPGETAESEDDLEAVARKRDEDRGEDGA